MCECELGDGKGGRLGDRPDRDVVGLCVVQIDIVQSAACSDEKLQGRRTAQHLGRDVDAAPEDQNLTVFDQFHQRLLRRIYMINSVMLLRELSCCIFIDGADNKNSHKSSIRVEHHSVGKK